VTGDLKIWRILEMDCPIFQQRFMQFPSPPDLPLPRGWVLWNPSYDIRCLPDMPINTRFSIITQESLQMPQLPHFNTQHCPRTSDCVNPERVAQAEIFEFFILIYNLGRFSLVCYCPHAAWRSMFQR